MKWQARSLLAVAIAAAAWHPVMAADPVRLYAAGSLKAALSDVAKAYEEAYGAPVEAEFAASGLLRERIEGGAPADVFASADMGHPGRLMAAGWGGPVGAGRARGLALHESFGSIVAQVAEVSLGADGPRVHRVVCAIDCGTVVNPAIVAQQMEGSVIFALTAALHGRIDIRGGVVRQGNFADYPMVRLASAPRVETWIVPSERPPAGVGEPGVPPLAPAVANALFALTGERHRKLPLARG